MLDVLNRVGTATAGGILGLPQPLLRPLAGPARSVDGNTLEPAVRLMLRVDAVVALSGAEGASVDQRRTAMVRGARLAMPVPRHTSSVKISIPTASGNLDGRRYRDDRWGDSPRPTIVYLHGGGWVVGDLDSHDAVCRQIAVGSGCNIVSIDYRLAPEHPFPAAIDDAVAAFRWVRDHPERTDIPEAVAIMGDSAGGNLAAVASMVVRDSGDSLPLAQGLIYPVTDVRMNQPSITSFADGYFLTRADMEWYRGHYSPSPDLWRHPHVSPLLAADHRGLPPTAIWTAGFDPLRDEGMAYAQVLRDSGVPVLERCYTDQVHGFASMGILRGGVNRLRSMADQVAGLMPIG